MPGSRRSLGDYLEACSELLDRVDSGPVESLVSQLFAACQAGRFVFLCGNGGSGATATHVCEDLGKSTLSAGDIDNESAKRLRIISLTDNTPYILAWANDEGFDRVFVEQLKNLASPGDMLISFSGSGNSRNVLMATEWANTHGLTTWGVTGFSGGRLQEIVHCDIHVPSFDMGLVESVHLLVFHWVLDELYHRLHSVSDQAATREDVRPRIASALS